MLKFGLVFFVMLMTITINLPDSIIARVGIEPDYMLASLTAIIITGLIQYRKLALIVLVVFMSLGANMPEDFMLNFGINRDYLAAGLVAIVLTPFIAKQFD